MATAIALRMAMRFERINRDARGFRDEDALRAFRETCVFVAKSAVKTCPASYDSSTKFVFADGSVLELDNPRQAAFPAAISPIALAIEAQKQISQEAGEEQTP